MKRRLPLLSLLILATACTALPTIEPDVGRGLGDGSAECRHRFLRGSWQFQHAIEATLADGHQSVLIGVSRVSAASGFIRTILITIEGLVVFDAEYGGEIRILRAVSPFDSEHFAEGLFNDIRLIFLMPQGALTETGTLPGGAPVCRYRQPDRQVVDIIRHSDRHWELRQFSRRSARKRTVEMFFNDPFRFDGFQVPGRVKLTAHGYNGYILDMDLIEAVSLDGN